ncbi:MAG: hypothetical protein ABI629_18605 [bacterium]
MDKIDVSRFVRDMESALRSEIDRWGCQEILATCERWQYDEQLDDSSRSRVRRLLREYGSL